MGLDGGIPAADSPAKHTPPFLIIKPGIAGTG